MERALEKAVSKVWAAQIRVRGLGEDGRGHPRHKSRARARTARVSFWGTASPAPLEAPYVSASISTGRAGSLSYRRPRMGEASSLEDAPTLCSPAARPGLGSPSRSRQRGGAEHLEAKTSSKPGLRMRRVSSGLEPAELPLPTSASTPAPARCYLLRFRGFPPTWADATSSK